jgi:cytosine/adenosine deaminase-related metal-dependent hydrolase
VIANHVIFADPEVIDPLAARGVRIARYPFGSSKEGKIAPIVDYLDRDIPVGLATDSRLSNNAVSMLRELALRI